MSVRGRPTKWDKWYSTTRWARIRKHQLLEHPLCKYCLERGIVAPATICNHVEPHHGDVNKFWLGPFMSLCKRCHDSTKRFVETRGFRPDIGLDGWPWTRATRSIGTNARRLNAPSLFSGSAAGSISVVESVERQPDTDQKSNNDGDFSLS